MTATVQQSGAFLAAYDREAAYLMLREWTTRRLAGELLAGRFGGRLSAAQAAELQAQLHAWSQRALADLPLRDAMLVDERRGRRVFDLICVELTVDRVALPAGVDVEPAETPVDLDDIPATLAALPEMVGLEERARSKGLALALLVGADEYPFPANLTALVPPLPGEAQKPAQSFEQPAGWRQRIAGLLAVAGVLQLGVPLLYGRIPEYPAGLPLALLTLALLVGIRAGLAGFAGSACIWLVANMPAFRHGTQISGLLPALPLLAAGVLLLARDRRVRAMWRWIRGLVARRHS